MTRVISPAWFFHPSKASILFVCLNWLLSAGHVEGQSRLTGNSSPTHNSFVGSAHQATFDSVLAKRYQRAIDSVRLSKGIVGVSAAVFLPGQAPWLGVSGVSYGNVAIAPNMKFDIASNTKSFVSTTILQLAEEGLLSLDDSLSKYLAPLPNITGSVTIRQLLNMTSGLSDYILNKVEAAIFADPSKSWTPEEAVAAFVGPPLSTPGGQWMYCNTNYILLGMVIKQITSSSISSRIRQRILTPLSLDSTYFGGEEAFSGPSAHPWYWNYGDIFSMSRTAMYSIGWSAGAIVSTAADITRAVTALFDGSLIKGSSLVQMQTCIPITPGITIGGIQMNAYGLGVFQAYSHGKMLWGHGGHGYGYRSFMAYIPDLKASFVAFINQSPGDPEELIAALLDKTLTGISGRAIVGVPYAFALDQNYPNPFNPSTTIRFGLPNRSHVTMAVFNTLGQSVSTLVNGDMEAGYHEVQFEGSGLSSGVYFYRLDAGEFVQTKRLIVLK